MFVKYDSWTGDGVGLAVGVGAAMGSAVGFGVAVKGTGVTVGSGVGVGTAKAVGGTVMISCGGVSGFCPPLDSETPSEPKGRSNSWTQPTKANNPTRTPNV